MSAMYLSQPAAGIPAYRDLPRIGRSVLRLDMLSQAPRQPCGKCRHFSKSTRIIVGRTKQITSIRNNIIFPGLTVVAEPLGEGRLDSPTTDENPPLCDAINQPHQFYPVAIVPASVLSHTRMGSCLILSGCFADKHIASRGGLSG